MSLKDGTEFKEGNAMSAGKASSLTCKQSEIEMSRGGYL